MPLSREFKVTIRERASRDPAFRRGMLRAAIEALASGEAYDGKMLLRDYINATIGFEALGAAIDSHPKTLMRILSPKGNPTLEHLSAVLRDLERREQLKIRVTEDQPRRRARAPEAA